MSETVLVDPKGVEYVTESAVEINNLLNKGYKRKARPAAQPAPVLAPKSDK